MNKWDVHFLFEAASIATMSKDPSTKCGAVIVNEKRIIVGKGFNGLPRRVPDLIKILDDRKEKYPRIIHADANAILNSASSLDRCHIYTWPFPPCSACANLIVQAGIYWVTAPKPADHIQERWGDDLDIAYDTFRKSGTMINLIDWNDITGTFDDKVDMIADMIVESSS